MADRAPRRTQAQRSAATQQLLVDAATELLIERGWAATTAVAVCERAGCTRGALVHHYPSLSALLAHALETIYADFARMRAERPTGLVDALDRMWTAMSDRRFKAVLEAWSAAGNDRELATEIAPAIGRFAKLMSVGDPSRFGDDTASFALMAREAMLGLALGRSTNGGEPLAHEAVVLDRLRREAAQLDAQPARRRHRVRGRNGYAVEDPQD
jgi:AcrR family transcriptional regulator